MMASLQTLRIPERIASHDDFETLVVGLQRDIEFVEASLGEKLSRLECTECARLDESLVCFQNYCFYAAVVMAVSAVEFRIAAMIRRSDPELFQRHFQGATLGQLLAVFQGDAYKGEEFLEIKKLMPERHNPLVVLLNNYRVFAAHPTERKVTGQIAEAIVHLAFSFLTDPDTCPYTAEEMACGS
jgi:hypothetical protein